MHKGLDDPDVLEQRLGLSVYAVIPHSDSQRRLFRRGKLRASENQKVLAVSQPKDIAVESLRSLRTSLQFTLMEASNQVVTVSGPAPGIGKSFVSVNLAHVLADSGKRVLLVDGDIRKGYLNDYFGVLRMPGLADVLAGAQEFAEVIHKTSNPNLEFMGTGTLPTNPSELLVTDRFRLLFAKLATAYDIVLYDTPPIMAVTDAAVIGRMAGVNLLVLKAGQHPLREITASVRRFEQGGAKVHGVILNDMSRKQGAHGYGKYSYYQYEYK
jgi:tyrosine-protein kinase Etk/Wzc